MATYYVSNTGSDAAAGTTPATAWLTVSKVNGTALAAGDTVLFKRGDKWREELVCDNAGSAGLPVTYGAYGAGPKPIITALDALTGWAQVASRPFYSVAFTDALMANPQVFQDGERLGYVAWDTSADTTFGWAGASPKVGYWTLNDPGNVMYVWCSDAGLVAPGVDPDMHLIEFPKRSQAVSVVGVGYVTLKDLDLEGGLYSTVSLVSTAGAKTDIIVEDCDLHKAGSQQVHWDTGGNAAVSATIRRCRIFDTCTLAAVSSGVRALTATVTGAVVVQDCEMFGVGHAVYANAAASLVVKNNYIHDSEDDGLYVLNGGAGTVQIIGNVIYHGEDDGINLDTTNAALILHNTIVGCSDAAFCETYNTVGTVIEGNIFSDNNKNFSQHDNACDMYVSSQFGRANKNVYFSNGTFTWVVNNNVILVPYTMLTTWRAAMPGSDLDSVVANPGLENPGGGNFEVGESSPAMGRYCTMTPSGKLFPDVQGYWDKDRNCAGAVRYRCYKAPLSKRIQYLFCEDSEVGGVVFFKVAGGASRDKKITSVNWGISADPTEARVSVFVDGEEVRGLPLRQAADRIGSLNVGSGIAIPKGKIAEVRLYGIPATAQGTLNVIVE